MFQEQSHDLKAHMDGLIKPLTAQVTYTNGKLKKVTVMLTVISSVVLTLLFTNGSELVGFLKLII